MKKLSLVLAAILLCFCTGKVEIKSDSEAQAETSSNRTEEKYQETFEVSLALNNTNGELTFLKLYTGLTGAEAKAKWQSVKSRVESAYSAKQEYVTLDDCEIIFSIKDFKYISTFTE